VNPTAKALVALLEQYGPSALAAVDDVSRAFLIAEGVKAMQEVVKGAIDKIMPLQGSSLGFRTDKDKDGGYPNAVVIECATEALLRGLRLTGNEWNIIGGRCYVAQAGCARLVSTYPGLTDLEHAPGVPVMGNGGAIVEYTMRWKLDDKPMELTRQIPVRVNSGMGMDAVLGKAKRKMLAAVYERVSGSILSEGEPEEPVSNITARASLPPVKPPKPPTAEDFAKSLAASAAEGAAALKDAWEVVVDHRNMLTKDEYRQLEVLKDNHKASLTAAKPATEGDDSSDPPTASAAGVTTPTAGPATAAGTPAVSATVTSSTALIEPKPTPALDTKRRVLVLIHKRNMTWQDFRGDKGQPFAEAAGIYPIADDCGLGDLPEEVLLRLERALQKGQKAESTVTA
jgi:hypothetical protein